MPMQMPNTTIAYVNISKVGLKFDSIKSDIGFF